VWGEEFLFQGMLFLNGMGFKLSTMSNEKIKTMIKRLFTFE